MFWGLIMEPYKRYSQVVEKAFHITNAALDVTTGDNDVCQIMVGSEGKDFLICSLQKGKVIQCPLQLFFKEGSDISFTSSGKGTIHMTGFLEPEDMFGDEEDEESGEEEEEEEVPELTPIEKKEKKRKADFSPDVVNNKKPKNGVDSKKAKVDSSDDDDDDDSDEEPDLAKLLEDDESDENDESYRPNDTNEISQLESEDDDEEDDDEAGDSDDAEEASEEEEAPKVLTKREKKQLNKEKAQQNGVSEKKNKNKENEPQQKVEEVKKEKKMLPGNVGIEDLKVGQGPLAKTGKMVQVYYEGRLKSNNKMFDSCLKGPGFKFKLGKKEVISGWDVGLVGMKVGGKRRIVCPPGMAYGKKGSPPVIPPNSTLVFDVELKNVN